MILWAALTPNLGETVVKFLAVAGGAAVGALVFGGLVQLLGRMIAHRPVPRPALLIVRLLGAAATGLAVWLFVFGSGGGGLGGGGWGFGGSGGTGGETGTGTTGKDSPPVSQRDKPPTTPAAQPEEVLRVEMLGGKRYKGDERFYLAEGENGPLQLFEVRKLIEQRRQKSSVKVIEIVIRNEGSVAESHPAVKLLKQLASDQELAVKVTTTPGEAP